MFTPPKEELVASDAFYAWEIPILGAISWAGEEAIGLICVSYDPTAHARTEVSNDHLASMSWRFF